jgi:hypothetical protein
MKDQDALVEKICGFEPMSYSFKPDGSLVVINSTGQKVAYPPEAVKAAGDFPAKPADKPAPKPKAKK